MFLGIFLFFHKDVFAIDGFLCWAIIKADCLGCSFCGAVIFGKDGGLLLRNSHSSLSVHGLAASPIHVYHMMAIYDIIPLLSSIVICIILLNILFFL